MSRPLPCETAGAGDGALVLVHGYLGSSRHWARQLDTLSRQRRVIAVNLAGFGAGAHLPPLDTIAGHGRQVLETLSSLGIAHFDLLGHSMGGMIAQQMAATAPERIGRLILYGTGPQGVLPDRFEPIETTRQRLEQAGLEATARRVVATWFEAGEAAPAFAPTLAEARRASPDAALASLTAWEHWDGRAALADLRMPTLVLWGDGDRSYPWSQPEALWRGIRGSRLAVVPGCAHGVHLEKPSIFDALVEDFLTTTRQSPRSSSPADASDPPDPDARPTSNAGRERKR